MNVEYDIEYFDEIDSTNNEAKRRISEYDNRAESAPADIVLQKRPFVLVARSQTSGRGRQGKSFFSPKGTGIYLTAACPMDCEIAGQVTVTSKVAVAVSKAIEGYFGVKCSIKWVNDIYVGNRKCCGILCEAVNDYENNKLRYIIIGVGVNVYTHEWPRELAGIAGSIFNNEEHTGNPDEEKLSEEEFRNFAECLSEEIMKIVYEPDGSEMDYYRDHSCVIGHEISYFDNRAGQAAMAVGIDENGGLIVELPSGERRILDSGEITVRLS